MPRTADVTSSQEAVALRKKPWRKELRAQLAGKIGPLAVSSAVSYAAYSVCGLMLGSASLLAVATRVLCALCLLVFAASVWSNARVNVLRMLVRRPKYVCNKLKSCAVQRTHARTSHSTAFLQGALLPLLHTGQQSTAPINATGVRAILGGSARLGNYCCTPMGTLERLRAAHCRWSSSAPSCTAHMHVGIQHAYVCPAFLQLATLAALTAAYKIGWCRAQPTACLQFYHDYKWEVNVQAGNATVANHSSNTHTVLSSLDMMYSGEFIALVIALQAYARVIPFHACMLLLHQFILVIDLPYNFQHYQSAAHPFRAAR